jgi:predicted kinase
MNTLILMAGLPRSGKSTWAKKQKYPIVNRDSIRLALHGQRYVAEAESFVTAIEDIIVKALFLAGHDTVIVDATHMTAERRKRWYSGPWNTELKIIPTTKSECIKRALQENDDVIIPVIERMAEETDIPGLNK